MNRLQSATENISTQTWKQTFTYDRYANDSPFGLDTTNYSSGLMLIEAGSFRSLEDLPPIETITVDLNIVYDEHYTLEEAQKAMKPQLKDLSDTLGQIGISFNVTYSKGTANKDYSRIRNPVPKPSATPAIRAILARLVHFGFRFDGRAAAEH